MVDERFKLPLHLLALDFLGTALAMLGLFEWLSDSSIVPDQLKFENYHVAMIVVGGLSMVPLVLHVVNRARRGTERAG